MTLARAGLAIWLSAALVLTACSSNGYGDGGESTSDTADAAEAAAAAEAVCGVLVDFDDTVAAEVNEASGQITVDTDPDDARRLLLVATAAVGGAADDLPGRYAALDLPDDGDVGRLVEDVSANAETVNEQLDHITDKLTDGLAGLGARNILSETFIDYEKVQSLAQPEQGDYSDPALVAALDTEPACEHTVSR